MGKQLLFQKKKKVNNSHKRGLALYRQCFYLFIFISYSLKSNIIEGTKVRHNKTRYNTLVKKY